MATIPRQETGLLANILGLGLPALGARQRQGRAQSAENLRLAQLAEQRETELEQRREENLPLISALGGDALAFPAIAGQAEQLLELPAGEAQAGLAGLLQQGRAQTAPGRLRNLRSLP